MKKNYLKGKERDEKGKFRSKEKTITIDELKDEMLRNEWLKNNKIKDLKDVKKI